MKQTKVEDTIRSQLQAWKDISQKIADIPRHDFPHDSPKRILLFGVGSSHFAARLAAYSLLRDPHRPRVQIIATHSVAMGREVFPQAGDWAIGLTHRGGSKPTNDALAQCERVGAFSLAICGTDARPIETADMVLPIIPYETVEPHTVAVSGAICAITNLMMGPKASDAWSELCEQYVHPDLEELCKRVGNGPTIVLGENEGEWLARETALKLMEMARLTPRSFGSEEYFHGPKFSKTKADKYWYCSSRDDGRMDQIQTELKPEYEAMIQGTHFLGYIPSLLNLQWASLAVALNLGVNPDDPNV